MQKKSIVIVIVLLAALALWYFLRDTSSGTSDKNKTEFYVENIEEIDKIFLSNKLEGDLLLEKKNGTWFVNGKYEVFKPSMEFFLNETIKKIRVRGPVPLPARANVIASMASTATKVEIYTNNELHKVYYVGQPNNDMTGTYMYIQGSKDPYITHIPGFEGFLTSRYPIAEREWMNKVIFDFKPQEIQMVDVEYPDDINACFTISRKEKEGDFDITAAETAPLGNLNYAGVKSYFTLFGFKYCEGFESFTPQKTDSILKSKPYCIVSVTDKKGNITRMRVYRRPAGEKDHGLYDKDGKRLVYDASRYFAVLNEEKRILVIQEEAFGPILIQYSDFIIKKSLD